MKYISWRLSGKFWVAMCVMVLLCACSRFQGDPARGDLTVLQVFFIYSRSELLELGETACACQVFMGFRDMEWFMVALPVIASFPVLYDFAEEWSGGNYYQVISRSSRSRYAAGKLWKAASRGFGAVVSGIFLYGILVFLRFPSLGEYQLTPEESMTVMAYGMSGAARLFCFLKAALHTGWLAAIAAVFCSLLVIVLRDRFLSVTFPILLEYFSIKLLNLYYAFLYGRYGADEIPLIFRVIEFLFPSGHLYYDNTFQVTYGLRYGCYFIFTGGFAFLICILFLWVVERRSD